MSERRLAFGSDDVDLLQDFVVYQGYFSTRVLELTHRCFNGERSPLLRREVFCRGSAAAVLIVDPVADTLLLLEQFRPGAVAAGRPPWMLELVAGIIDRGETAEAVARREAVEEAGIYLDQLQFVMRYFPSPGACDEELSLFVAYADLSGAEGIYGLAEEGEDIRTHVLAIDEAAGILDAGQVANATTVIGLQWLLRRRAEGRPLVD